MTSPAALILRAPGINCERETCDGFRRAGAAPEYVHVKRLLQEPRLLERFAILAVPGGFAYGDDIAAGRVLAHSLRERIGAHLLAFVERGGLVLGICNGFQVLVRVGLLPRTGGGPLRQEVTLAHNLSNHYECRWVTLLTTKSRCAFLPEGMRMQVPAAHGEGYLVAKDAGFGRLLADEGYRTFVYVDADGVPTTRYPYNPNGSPDGVAGLTDCTGRVLGLMPHPDRSYLPTHMPGWTRSGLAREGDGMFVFTAMVKEARGS